MSTDKLAQALHIAVWLAFALIVFGMVLGAILTERPPPKPVAFVRPGLLHKGPSYPEFGRPF